MTKKVLKQEMVALIEHYYKKADMCEDEFQRQIELAKTAGIEILAYRLNIKLWEDKYKIENQKKN